MGATRVRDRKMSEAALGEAELGGLGCWVWTGHLMPNGYGRTKTYRGRRFYAHRLAYEFLVGPIPEALQLDHLCRNRACVRPSHLEPVTQKVNLLRGETIPAKLAARTLCNYGHELVSGRGGRTCRECSRIRDRARYPGRYAREKAGR